MGFASATALLVIGLFFGMILCFELGKRVGDRQLRRDAAGSHSGTGAIDSAIFGLLALLVGFTFLGAANRFDQRRDLIVDEANMIGTAYLRLDLLLPDQQEAARETFRTYLDTRLDFYRSLSDDLKASEYGEKASALQFKIWQDAVAASRVTPDAGRLLLPALNEMIDVTTTRTMAMRVHPPTVIFVMLFGLCLAAAVLAGYGMAKSRVRNWLYMVGFAATLSIAIYVILDLEYPRFGLIRVDDFDQALVDLRNSMK